MWEIGLGLRKSSGKSDSPPEGTEGPKPLVPGLIIVTDNLEIRAYMDRERIHSYLINENDQNYVHLERFLT